MMFIRDIIPTISNYCSIILACIATRSIKSAMSVHGVLVKTGLSCDTFAINRLLHAYCKCDSVGEARKMFDEIPMKNVRSWNAMVSAYSQTGEFSKALELFSRMPERDIVCCNSLISGLSHCGLYRESLKLFQDFQKDCDLVVMDEYTFVDVVGSCARLGALKLVRQVHGVGVAVGLDWNGITCNVLIDAYGKCCDSGASYKIFIQMSDEDRDVVSWTSVIVAYTRANRLDDAYEVFDLMPHRNTVSWTAMIAGYAQSGKGDEALDLFRQMNEESVIPSPLTFVSVLGACADMAVIERGKQIHGYITRTISNTDMLNVYVSNALVDMYCKCGDMNSAEVIFKEMPHKDIVSWNSMITGYSQNGFGHKALFLLKEMIEENIQPNHVTFLGVLSACSHTGLGNEALDIVDLMVNHHNVVLTPDHFAILIDALGRRNRLQEATDLIQRCPDKSHHVAVWGSLLASSRVHGNVKIARRAADALLELEPWNVGRYVMMSNTYAAANKWHDSEEVRIQLEERALAKDVGNSSIEVKNETHNFAAKDRSHHQMDDIYELVKSLTIHMK
ncbi:hypothetical protein MLD38_028421 [Melastoma candidum]|uniref:Uncharacterized protein n=1 Tax=Melastoma candidum TaxID=119954 RepID=A0ACB9N0S5_9MYRT|nr:hypothetical protein MLD38_028421 [Melastoma candidum]